jgi:hypothetical protein
MSKDGPVIEIATIGREGMVGLQVFLGVSSFPGFAFCQVAGDAWWITSDAFRAVDGAGLQRQMQRYRLALFVQIVQNVACNRLDGIEQRCARWLLFTTTAS